MKRFEIVHSAVGDDYISARKTLDELFDASSGESWCDVCKGWKKNRVSRLP